MRIVSDAAYCLASFALVKNIVLASVCVRVCVFACVSDCVICCVSDCVVCCVVCFLGFFEIVGYGVYMMLLTYMAYIP